MVRCVNAAGIVDCVGVDAHPAAGGFHASALGAGEVAALHYDAGAHVFAVDADRVVGLVADVEVRFFRGLEVGADPAEVQKVDGGAQDCADQVIRRGGARFDSEGLGCLFTHRDGFGAAGEHAAACGDELLRVVLPGRAGKVVQALALLERCGRIRVGVDEDVAVVKRCDQAGVGCAQHAVAEHVAAHVAHADDGEVVFVRVDPKLTEVALRGLPGTSGGDAHFLVVVAVRPTGGEGVTQPEAAGGRDCVGHVGEARRALVCGDHEVGVFAVVYDGALRADGRAVGIEVVGDVQQRADELFIGSLAQLGASFGVPDRQALRIEAALRTRGHDEGVLDHLGLRQAEGFRAEVIAAIRPAQAAAGDRTETQVHALNPRRVDPGFDLRARQRQEAQLFWQQFERERRRQGAVARVVEVGAHNSLDEGQHGAHDAVLIEGRQAAQAFLDSAFEFTDRGFAVTGEVRVELSGEQINQAAGKVCVGREHTRDVAVGVGHRGLAQVADDCAQNLDFAPVQSRQQQAVEVAVFAFFHPPGQIGVFQPAEVSLRDGCGELDAEVVQVALCAIAERQAERTFVDDVAAHGGQQRQHGRQRRGLALVEQHAHTGEFCVVRQGVRIDAGLAQIFGVRFEAHECASQTFALFKARNVGQCVVRRVGLFVGAGEGVAPLGHAGLIAVGYAGARGCEEFLHVFAPGAHGSADPVGHFCGVDRGKRFAAGHPGGEVQTGER